jgi:HAD superfamily hydrolase (TIGR01509 family)
MRRFEAVIFDMDGVLIDSEPLHFAVLHDLLAAEGHAYTRADNEEFIGTTTEALFVTLIPRLALPGSIAEYEARYHAAVLRVLGQPHDAAEGVTTLVHRLRELGVRIGVASSSHRAWIGATLRSIGLSGMFDAIVSGDDVEHGKPDPSIYLLAAKHLGVDPERCLAIEDSPNGVASARRAGMAVLGVRTPYTAHLPLDGATRVVDSLSELDLAHDPTTLIPACQPRLT